MKDIYEYMGMEMNEIFLQYLQVYLRNIYTFGMWNKNA